jgi:membrane-associated phospholipid phosphatase
MNAILNRGVDFIAGLQNSAPWLEAPSRFFSFLGTEKFYLFLLPFLYWCVDVRLGLRVGVILSVSDCLNAFLKLLFHQPRPYWVSNKVRVIKAEVSYGLPSGHAQHAVTVWGTVAAWGKGWLRWLMATLIFLIGLSRIALAVHFPTDVLAGWFIGGVILWAFLKWEAPVIAWFNLLTLFQKIGVAFAASVLLILISFAGLAFVPSVDPSHWKADFARAFSLALDQAAIRLRATTGAVGVGGTFFGLVAGAILIFQRGGFDARGTWPKRALRFIVGMIGVIILWLGLTTVFPRDASLISQVLRYVRYALIGFWVSYAAPRILIKLGLQNTTKVSGQPAPTLPAAVF